MDCLTPEQRRKNMQAIRSKDTSIEISLRHELWTRGYRYRKNYKGIPGHPDIVFVGKKVAVFCDSEFWHGYDWDNQKNRIGTRKEYWIPKIERNIAHDLEINSKLEAMGWIVIRFWGFEIKKDVSSCADRICDVLKDV